MIGTASSEGLVQSKFVQKPSARGHRLQQVLLHLVIGLPGLVQFEQEDLRLGVADAAGGLLM